MYVTLNVSKWKGHVSPRDGGSRQFIINPSKIVEMKAHGTGTKLYFDDYVYSRRDKPAYLEVQESIATIRTAYDTPTSLTTTLPIYRKNDTSSATDNVTILTDSLVYADRYNGSPLNTSWVVLEKAGFKVEREKVLVALSIEEILTGTSRLLDYDGNGYTTVTIGTQEWIVENYRVTHYADGTAISNITNDALWQADTTGAYCYYDNDATNFDFIGLLYNWYALGNVHVFPYLERGGLQEVGWRVPTILDWNTLANNCGGVGVAGGHLKEQGLVHWTAPNTDATDTYGFKWISGGNRYIDEPAGDGFDNQGIYGDIWSADEVTPATGDSVYAYYDDGVLYNIAPNKFCGLNVRLVRDV